MEVEIGTAVVVAPGFTEVVDLEATAVMEEPIEASEGLAQSGVSVATQEYTEAVGVTPSLPFQAKDSSEDKLV